MENKKRANVGGQAVIEGIMMKGTKCFATAVRKPDGKIVYKKTDIITDKKSIFKAPFIRGVIMLFDALIIGTKELSFSAVQSGEEEEEISKFELGSSIGIAMLLGLSLFFLLPSAVSGLISKNEILANLAEGGIRVTLFVGYVMLISLSKDIQRVFQYHGAEHKSIYTYENGEELTVDNVKKYTTLHPRCGTSFLFIVMFISIILFSIIDLLFLEKRGMIIDMVTRFGLRIIFLPFVAGISYEIQRYTSKHLDNPIIKLVAMPGLMLQKITTKEPDEKQMEVGIVALKVALGEEVDNAEEFEEEKK